MAAPSHALPLALALGACAAAPIQEAEIPVVPVALVRDVDAPPPSVGERLGLLAAAAQALADDRPQRALQLLDGYLAVNPDNGMAHFLLGVALLDLGRLEQSLARLEESVRLDPDDPGGLGVLARVQHELGDLDGAVSTLERAVDLDPGSARHWTSLGLLYFQQDRWRASYDAFRKAVDVDPADAEAHRGLGRLYAYMGEAELAARAYRTALGHKGTDPSLHVALGHVLRDADKHEGALRAYERALELDPGNPWIEANIASTWLERKRPLEARPHFETALSALRGRGPDVAMVLHNYGMMLEALGDIDGAVLAYEDALLANPDLGVVYESAGLLALDRGRRGEARDLLHEAFLRGVLVPDAVVELALLHEEFGDGRAAQACALAVLEDDAGDPSLVFRRAQLLLRSKDPEVRDPEAAAVLLRGLVADPLRRHGASWMLLAEALAQTGRLEEALAALERVLDGTPNDSTLHERCRVQRDRLLDLLADG